MCGIAGVINPEKDNVIKRMANAITHRGPDDEGYFKDKDIALGMRRLSIIDLAGGGQPITSSDERFIIFFNGEIYNYKELRKDLEKRGYQFKTESDTEVVLALFLKSGPEALNSLRGMFAFAIYDREEKELFLARDFFGIKPLYYLLSQEEKARVVAFSSEIKSFYAIPEFEPEVNDEAVFDYLSYQYNPLEETFFRSVYKLPPAHYMIVNLETGKVVRRRYWQFKFSPNPALDERRTAREIRAVMEDSVRHHMVADVPVGSFLSGGIDSSIIATLLKKLRGGKQVKTFTISFGSWSEAREAEETSTPLGTDHREFNIEPKEYFKALPKAIWHFDEPVADPSALGLFFLAREAAKEVKVVLSGEGSDELFGGYNIYLAPFAYQKLSWVPKEFLKKLIDSPLKFYGKNYLKRVYFNLSHWYIGNAKVFEPDEVDELCKSIMPEESNKERLKALFKEAEKLSDSTKMQYIDINTWLIGDILAKADKMTMAHSLELRVPFLDIEVARLAEILPDRFKWRGRTTKYLLREAFRGVLPESVRKRKKLGFPTPIKHWMETEEKKIYEVIFENPYIKNRMNISYIRKLVEEHKRGKHNHSRKIYALLTLAIWYNIFIRPQ